MRLEQKASQSHQDLLALHDFVQDWQLESGSIVRNKVKRLVDEYHRTFTAEKQTLSITVSVSNHKEQIFTVVVPMTSTLLDLKRRVESKSSIRTPISKFHVARNSASFNASSLKTIQECDIEEGDKLTADYSVPSHMGVQRIEASGLTANSSFQYMVLLLHAFMLDGGFQSVVDVKNARDNYHPICKAMHEGEFLRPNWNADPCSIDLLYSFGHEYDRQVVLLSCEDLMGAIFVSLSLRHSKRNRYMELPVYEYIDERKGSDQKLKFTVLQGKTLRWQLMRLVNAVFPRIRGNLWRPRYKSVDCSGLTVEQTLALAHAHYAAVEAGRDDAYLEYLTAAHLSGQAHLLQEESLQLQEVHPEEQNQHQGEERNQQTQPPELQQEQAQVPHGTELSSGTAWLPAVSFDSSNEMANVPFPHDDLDARSGVSIPDDVDTCGEDSIPCDDDSCGEESCPSSDDNDTCDDDEFIPSDDDDTFDAMSCSPPPSDDIDSCGDDESIPSDDDDTFDDMSCPPPPSDDIDSCGDDESIPSDDGDSCVEESCPPPSDDGDDFFPCDDDSYSVDILDQRVCFKQSFGGLDDSSVDVSEYTAPDSDDDSVLFEETISRQLPHSPARTNLTLPQVLVEPSVQSAGLQFQGARDVPSVAGSPKRSPIRRERWVQALRDRIRGYGH